MKTTHQNPNKIYNDDPNLPYKSTRIDPIHSKSDIDAILAKYGITKVGWEFDLDHQRVVLHFQLSEKFRGIDVNPLIRLVPPIIWQRRTRTKPEEIDWRVSMRVFFWGIKNQLAWAYANQSQRVVAFLAHVAVSKDKTIKDVAIPHLDDLKRLEALPEAPQEDSNQHIIDVDAEEV